MTLKKRILAGTITITAIMGLIFISVPAQAGFFDWFKNTPLNQEAAAIRIIKKGDTEETSFLKNLFSSTTKKKVAKESKSEVSKEVENTFYYNANDRSQIKASLLQLNDDTVDVIYLQNSLLAQGLFKGEVSGLFDKKTKEAVVTFQKKQGLRSANGIADEKTISLLNSLTKISGVYDGKNPGARITNGVIPFRWPEIRYPLGPIVYGPGGPVDPGSIPNPNCGNNVTFKDMHLPFSGTAYKNREQDFINIQVTAPTNCPIAITEIGLRPIFVGTEDDVNNQNLYRTRVKFLLNGSKFTPSGYSTEPYIFGGGINAVPVGFPGQVPAGQTKTLTVSSGDPIIEGAFSTDNVLIGDIFLDDYNGVSVVWAELADYSGFKMKVEYVKYQVNNANINGQPAQFIKNINIVGPQLAVRQAPNETYWFEESYNYYLPKVFTENVDANLIRWDADPWSSDILLSSPFSGPFIGPVIGAVLGSVANQEHLDNLMESTQIDFCYPSDFNNLEPRCEILFFNGSDIISDGPIAVEFEPNNETSYVSFMDIQNSYPQFAQTRTGKIRIKKTNGTRDYYSPYNVTITSSALQ